MIISIIQDIHSFFVNVIQMLIISFGLSSFIFIWIMSFFKRIPSVFAIPACSIPLALAVYVYSWNSATELASRECKFLQLEAQAEGHRAAELAFNKILSENNRRLKIAERAAAKAEDIADDLKQQMIEAENERQEKERQINDLEKQLPENPFCITSPSLHGELSD